jgi:cell division cycle 14
MYFDDGSNPSDEIVRHFIRLAEDVIERQGKRVAVHCKAGLGRTGVLIGGKLSSFFWKLTPAYFIYKYQFSAQEVIAFMRIVRPGMVVGPQQQYMVANQMKWVGWVSCVSQEVVTS